MESVSKDGHFIMILVFMCMTSEQLGTKPWRCAKLPGLTYPLTLRSADSFLVEALHGLAFEVAQIISSTPLRAFHTITGEHQLLGRSVFSCLCPPIAARCTDQVPVV